jgi:hypothetical protein
MVGDQHIFPPAMTLTDYERARLAEIRRWQVEKPDWGTRVLAGPSGAAAKTVQALVPVSALRAALQSLNRLASRTGGERAILRRAGVTTLAELRDKDLETLDRLARGELKRAMLMGGTGGVVFGVVGAAGLVADVPTLLTLALRTIQRVALCYGEDEPLEARRASAIGIFALASANTVEEKRAAIAALEAESALLDAAWRDGVERVAERELAKEAALFSVHTLAGRIGVQLGKRKAGNLVPVLGAAIGGSVNAWYLRDIGTVAQYVFQERWLRRRYGADALAPAQA